MRISIALLIALAAPVALPAGAGANPPGETREQYLARLTDICAPGCLEPKYFQRAARKRDSDDTGDMAIIMDVVAVRLNGDRFELFDSNTEGSSLLEQNLLGSAGINTSGSNGIGGLPRGRDGVLTPNTVVVSLDAQAFADFLNPPAVSARAGQQADQKAADDEQIIVDGEIAPKARKPTLRALRSVFRNRRIVARGTPQLSVQWIGARRDHRRKQVTLVVDNADDLVLLPRYDENGEPRPEDLPWLVSAASQGGDQTTSRQTP